MEYIGVCLDRSSSSADASSSSSSSGGGGEILPFGGGGVVKIQFTSNGQTLLAAGDIREGLKAWKVLAPLSSTEKRILQAEEEAKRLIASAALAGIEANRENERANAFAQIEREKQRSFAAEMEKEKELERNELAEEQQRIFEDGGDLLASSHTPASAMKSHSRRPSEMLPSVFPSTAAATSTPSTLKSPRVVGWLDEELLANKEKDKAEQGRSSNEAAKKLQRRGTLNRRGTLKTIKKQDSDSDSDTNDDSHSNNTIKRLPTLQRTASKLNVLKSPKTPSQNTKLPQMTPNKGTSSSGAATARLPPGSSSSKQQPSGSSTAREKSSKGDKGDRTTFEAKTTVSVQSELRTKVTLDPAGARVTTTTQQTFVGVTTTTRTPVNKEKRKDGGGGDPAFATPRNADKSPSTKDGSTSDRRDRRGTMRRRRGDSDDEDENEVTSPASPRKSAASNFLSVSPRNADNGTDDSRRSIRLSPRRRGDDASTPASRSSLTSTPQPQLPPTFTYSDFEPDSLSAKLRVPHVLKPSLARLLPQEGNFADIHAGGIWCMSQDETIITAIKQYEGPEKTPCKKLTFIDRIKGKVIVCEKSHNGPASCMTLSEDGRKCIVGTKSGHAYVHLIDSPKWTYMWLKLRETDDPVPNLDLCYSPNGLALLASRQTKDSPLTVWNVKTNKLLSNLNGSMPPGANEQVVASVVPTSLTYHLGTHVKGVWTPDSEHVFSVGWAMEDHTVRMWRTVTRGMNPRTMCLGRLNTPYTHFRQPANFWSNAIAVSPNGKLLAIGLGLTLFLFNVEKQRCIQYVTLFDLMSTAEAEKDEQLAPNWIDPYAIHTPYLFPSTIVTAHTVLPNLFVAPPEFNDPLLPPTAPTPPPPAPLGRQRSSIGLPGSQAPTLTKRGSLTKENAAMINKRGSMGRDFLQVMPSLNKRASTQRGGDANTVASPPGLNKKGSVGHAAVNTATTAAASGSSSSAPERSQFVIGATDASFNAPAHTTPILTYFTSIVFSPNSASLAVATSIGGVAIYELTARVQKGEEEREQIDLFLFPARRAAQKAQYKAREHERAQFAAQEAARKLAAEQAERAREEERRQRRERAAEREARRNAREEARRLKLYVGSLPDLNYAPTPAKVVQIEPFFREGYNASLLAAVEEKGDFLVRLDDDVDARRRRAEERARLKEIEDAELLAAAVKLHGGPDLKPAVREQKLSSFMARLNKDLNKRKDFRDTADAGEYYHKIKDPRNSILQKPGTTLPAIR